MVEVQLRVRVQNVVQVCLELALLDFFFFDMKHTKLDSKNFKKKKWKIYSSDEDKKTSMTIAEYEATRKSSIY